MVLSATTDSNRQARLLTDSHCQLHGLSVKLSLCVEYCSCLAGGPVCVEYCSCLVEGVGGVGGVGARACVYVLRLPPKFASLMKHLASTECVWVAIGVVFECSLLDYVSQ